MSTHTSHPCVIGIGAAQALALHRCLLPPYCSQNGRGAEQCLTHPRTHSHQPKQVHCVRPVSHGEDHLREAQRGAGSCHRLNLSTPLLLSLHIHVCWKVNASFSFGACSAIADALLQHGVDAVDCVLGLCWRITAGFPLYFKGGDPKHWETGSPAKSLLMPARFL